jgi:hypothetical protein
MAAKAGFHQSPFFIHLLFWPATITVAIGDKVFPLPLLFHSL